MELLAVRDTLADSGQPVRDAGRRRMREREFCMRSPRTAATRMMPVTICCQ
jgi:hypothetical protein